MSTNIEPIRLQDDQLASLAARAPAVSFPRNAVIVTEGDRSDALYIIVSGQVRVFVSDENGREVVLGAHGPGEFFGEMVLDGEPRSASVMTLEPARLIIVPLAEVNAFLAASPEFALLLVRKLIARVRALTGNVKSLALLDVYGRVARLLIDLAAPRDGGLTIAERPTQQEIANRVGASREMVSRILSDLAAGGYIVIEGRRMVIRKKLPPRW